MALQQQSGSKFMESVKSVMNRPSGGGGNAGGSTVVFHHRIYKDIIRDIRVGRLRLGDKLPSQAELVRKYDVSVGTIRQSLANLERRGIIRREMGRGSFVSLQASNGPASNKLRTLGLISEITGYDYDAPAEANGL